MQLICKTPVLGLSSVKISAQSILYVQQKNKNEKKMEQTCLPMNPKIPPGVSKTKIVKSCHNKSRDSLDHR